ncbi:MAG TPA: prolyl oligopeptidase family serine peptidase [Chitinophaga sp.]|uniref:alpha/beta hydrolase family protein n=1 Tax=Chitinophaga sp. TaxID=1869181 RepID=UPI002C0844AD|nr:prolyl oligopeptidase family serine peptidase [Chitinophaga sp.]HVI46413.1 prolyl oligopeptidase family serine peptidase [Chitinophaga sp.]
MSLKRRRTFFRRLLKTVLIIAAISLYAHFIHPGLFFSKPALMEPDSAAMKKGKPVSFMSGSRWLKGRIIAPSRHTHKLPVIIFCAGSGGNISYASSHYPALLQYMLQDNLPEDSVVLLYMDKRGVGESEGSWYNTTFEERAADVKAAADYLKTLPYIDNRRIALVGHGEGGWVVQLCLAEYPSAFAGGISMAGSALNLRNQVTDELAGSAMCQDSVSEWEAVRKARITLEVEIFMSMLFPLREEWKQLSVTRRFEIAPYIKKIQKPLLYLFCENDARVSATHCLSALKTIFPAGYPPFIQVALIKATNHRFRVSPRCYTGTATLPFSEEARQYINNWVRNILL